MVSQPDRPSGRGMKLKASPLKEAAQSLGLAVETPERARDESFIARIRDLKPDALVVAAYGQILSPALLESAPRGGINLHGSILPAYRGAAPIQRALLAGETETGVTLMQMVRGMDSGDILAIERTPIGPDETYGALQSRLALLAADLLAKWMPQIESGHYPRTPQDPTLATFAPKIEKADAELRLGRDAEAEFRRFRATTPVPGAFLRLVPPEGSAPATVRVLQAGLSSASGPIGTILAVEPFPLVAFSHGSMALIEVRPEGKTNRTGREWANGWRLRTGQIIRHG